MAKNKVKKGNKSKGAKKPSIPPKALPVTLLSGFLGSVSMSMPPSSRKHTIFQRPKRKLSLFRTAVSAAHSGVIFWKN
ncbi:hypothetical protein LB505_006191 [Fusarium chuoi]|nr:hypothetical protein LB505_006191 [Fusarium chuoi]